MTVTALPLPATVDPRPGSRAARNKLPRAVDAVKALAVEHGVCVRPISLRRTDLTTGEAEVIDLPCRATREAKCPPCAKRNKQLREAQIKEGWHRADEPNPGPDPATPEQKALLELRAHFEFARDALLRDSLTTVERVEQLAELDAAIEDVEEAIAAEGLRGRVAPPHNPTDEEDQEDAQPKKRKRSTKRRQDAPDLPRQKVDPRTIGRAYTAPDGTVHRPSMWLTLTLGSYGPVHGVRASKNGKPMPCECRRWHTDDDPILGTPIDPDNYDYRAAAWDAVHFAALLDRFWQNLRRAVGWKVQYAGCVEPQKRLAPHAHFAIRGTISRAKLEQVTAATYQQVWWPKADQLVYTPDEPPIWDDTTDGFVDPATRRPLPTWDQALDAIDDDDNAEPAYVVRFGGQVKAKGLATGSRHIDRTIGYITKYVTKDADACHKIETEAQRDHLDRLWAELRITPCSERCANWLLYGVQPKNARRKLVPGACKGRVHQKATLGIGGRRILVSRDWSGKTLADHRADSRDWVRALLAVSDDPDVVDLDQARADTANGTAPPKLAWQLVHHDDPDLLPIQHRLLRLISQRIQWRSQLNQARERAGLGPPKTFRQLNPAS